MASILASRSEEMPTLSGGAAFSGADFFRDLVWEAAFSVHARIKRRTRLLIEKRFFIAVLF
jgi:hypothetical protein